MTKSTDSPNDQHAAVLALARAGATQYALAEYERFGLDKIKDLGDTVLLEDIISLGGRLYKDLALASAGNARKDYAQQSSSKYDAAFKKTGGHYSGINAATMALIAGFPVEMIKDGALNILEKLPDKDGLSKEDVYYVEATRAEAFLLLDDMNKAAFIFDKAVAHDPLNYAAHATTLKQFRMIVAFRNGSTDWITRFRPPVSVHFSGHMFGREKDAPDGLPTLNPDQIEKLRIEISDTIQHEDIGYGFGALAAGSDILIAEGLLAEGCELHVILPVSEKRFIEHSVAPYGPDWVERYKRCLKQASRVLTASSDVPWPFAPVAEFGSRVAMGDAVRHTNALSTSTGQLLIWDGRDGKTGTAADALAWRATGRPQFHIAYPGTRQSNVSPVGHNNLNELVLLASENAVTGFDNLGEACRHALDQRTKNPALKQSLHVALGEDKTVSENIANTLFENAVPGSITISENAANLLALSYQNEFDADPLGELDDEHAVFALRPIGQT